MSLMRRYDPATGKEGLFPHVRPNFLYSSSKPSARELEQGSAGIVPLYTSKGQTVKLPIVAQSSRMTMMEQIIKEWGVEAASITNAATTTHKFVERSRVAIYEPPRPGNLEKVNETSFAEVKGD